MKVRRKKKVSKIWLVYDYYDEQLEWYYSISQSPFSWKQEQFLPNLGVSIAEKPKEKPKISQPADSLLPPLENWSNQPMIEEGDVFDSIQIVEHVGKKNEWSMTE